VIRHFTWLSGFLHQACTVCGLRLLEMFRCPPTCLADGAPLSDQGIWSIEAPGESLTPDGGWLVQKEKFK